MDAFVEIFLKIDTNYDGIITRRELEEYTQENHLDPLMIEMGKLFTEEGKNYITLQNFLDVLGIAKEEFKEKRRQAVEQQSAFFKLGKDVEYIAGDMPLPQQINVSNESRSLIEEYRYDKTELISKTLKNFLDQIFGKSWHVTIVDSSFWGSYSHEPGTAFHFKLDRYYFSIWKTPDYSK